VIRAGILGLGLWLPHQVRTNDAWPESFVRQFREQRDARNALDLTHVERRTRTPRPYEELFERHAAQYDDDPFKGAIERRVAPDTDTSASCDARACREALEDARVHPEQVDLILSSALVPDRLAPSNGPAIQALVGCTKATALGVESLCSSALAQLEVAAGLVESGRARYVLCTQSHVVNRANPMTYPSSPIFGDAAAAFVVGAVPAGKGLISLVRAGDPRLADAVCWQCEDTPGAAWWSGGSGRVFPGTAEPEQLRELVRNCLAFPIETIKELSEKAEFPIDAAAAISTIQPLAWYQAAIADGLGVSPERVPSTYRSYGHVGGAAIVTNLLEARRRGLLRDGAPVVLYAHGAGLTRYAALLRWHAPSTTSSS
jgi:3-oxoacyl-[acyl-carrier-protein] synthase-3